MKLTRERKVYMAILAAAGAIWSLDQLLLSGGPQGAHAGVLDVPNVEVGAPSVASVPSSSAPPAAVTRSAADRTPQPTLASRLEALSRSLEAGEAAPPAEGLFEQPSWALPPKAEPKSAGPEDPPQRAFAKRHDVTAIMTGPKGLVVVSGRPLRLGDSIDGYVLKTIEKDAATFVRDGVHVRLNLDRTSRTADPGPASSEAPQEADASAPARDPARG